MPKYSEEDIVYEHFTRQFVEGDKVSDESTVKECEELPTISKEVREVTGLIENIIAQLESFKADVIEGTALIDRINVDNTFENDGNYNMNIDIDFKSNLKVGTNITPIGIFCPKVGTAGTGGWGRLERKTIFHT